MSKSKKNKVVLFQEGKVPRVVINADIEELSKLGTVLVNPKIPAGIPPHRWEKSGRNIQEGNDLIETGKVVLPNTPQETFIPEIDYADLEDIEMLLGKCLELNTNKADKIDVAKYKEDLENSSKEINTYLLDKMNRLCIIGGLVAFLLLLTSFRLEIQQLIRMINV